MIHYTDECVLQIQHYYIWSYLDIWIGARLYNKVGYYRHAPMSYLRLFLPICTWRCCTWGCCTWGCCTWRCCTWGCCIWGCCTWGCCTWGCCTWGCCTWGCCTWGYCLEDVVLGDVVLEDDVLEDVVLEDVVIEDVVLKDVLLKDVDLRVLQQFRHILNSLTWVLHSKFRKPLKWRGEQVCTTDQFWFVNYTLKRKLIIYNSYGLFSQTFTLFPLMFLF